jgi:hypothetical protein
MGLLAELLALSESPPLATPATRATHASRTANSVAESQVSQRITNPPAIESRRVAGVAGVAGVEEDQVPATQVLERFATANGIDWTAARSQLIDGDAEPGAAQLALDLGDGIEQACVANWLRLLASRAPPACLAWPSGYRTSGTGLDTHGKPLPAARVAVSCGDCRHFLPDELNLTAGAGVCRVDAGWESMGPALHPMAPRWCDQHAAATASDSNNAGSTGGCPAPTARQCTKPTTEQT